MSFVCSLGGEMSLKKLLILVLVFGACGCAELGPAPDPYAWRYWTQSDRLDDSLYHYVESGVAHYGYGDEVIRIGFRCFGLAHLK